MPGKLTTALSMTAGVLSAVSLCLAGTPATAQPTKAADDSLAAAPYLMPLENDPPNISEVMSATGVKTFTLAFVLSDGGCAPVWSGGAPVSSDTQVKGVIDTIRGAGGDVMPSVGGYGGSKLGETCSDAASLAKAYQQVIDAYGLHAIDFDIEATEFENDVSQQKVVDAVKIVADANPAVKTYITIAGGPSGFSERGSALVSKAAKAGTRVDGWTIMAFDFKGGATGMGQQTVKTMESVHGQLKSAYPRLSDDEVYAHTGLSSMNGRTDDCCQPETVHQSDFEEMLGYAQQHHLARFTFWAVNRDRTCADTGHVSGTCSSIPQEPWEFTKIVARYHG